MKNFKNLKEFNSHLKKQQFKQAAIKKAALETAAKHIEDLAKDKFGTYQEKTGPYQSWDELKDSTKDQRVRQGYTPNDPLERSGKTRDSITHVVEVNRAIVGSDSDVLVWQELGTTHIPPRSTLGAAAYQSREKVQKIFAAMLIEMITGKKQTI